MKNQPALSRRSRQLVSRLFFGGLILVAPALMADKPTMSQTSSGNSASSSSASSGSSSSGSSSSASSSSSGGSSRVSSGGSPSRNARSATRTRVRSNDNNSTPSRRGDVRRHRTSRSPSAAEYDTAKGNDRRGSRHRGAYGSSHRYRTGYGYGGYRHYHYSGCGHVGFGYHYGSPYYYYGPFGYIYYRRPHVSVYAGGYYREEMGALDLDVSPEKAQIFVDGNLVGVADQYDGFPAYLWLEKGTYDVVIYKEGYETISRQYTVYPGVVLDVSDRMVPGTAVKPEDLFAKSTARREERLRRNEERRAAAARQREGARVEIQQQTGIETEQEIARLMFNVTPDDAAVYLDGLFRGTAAELRQLSAGLIVEPGDHIVEAVRPGYETQQLPIQVPAGDRVSIGLELLPR